MSAPDSGPPSGAPLPPAAAGSGRQRPADVALEVGGTLRLVAVPVRILDERRQACVECGLPTVPTGACSACPNCGATSGCS